VAADTGRVLASDRLETTAVAAARPRTGSTARDHQDPDVIHGITFDEDDGV
jgi:hypothetical protein